MRLKKSNYIRVIEFNTDKSSNIKYYKSNKFKPNFLINPNHIFFANGYRTIVISDKASETINPLDFNSKYEPSHFKSAIESKIISDTFTSLKSDKIDIVKVLLLANIAIGLIIIYFILKGNGVI